MQTPAQSLILAETLTPGITTLYFSRADLRDALYEDAEITASPLYQEIETCVLEDLPSYGMLIINLEGLLPFGSAFYRLLLKIREVVRSRRARLVLCNLSSDHHQLFDLFGGYAIFNVHPWGEAEAGSDRIYATV